MELNFGFGAHVSHLTWCSVKEREQDRLVRVVEGLKASEAEAATRQAALEEALRKADADIASAKASNMNTGPWPCTLQTT